MSDLPILPPAAVPTLPDPQRIRLEIDGQEVAAIDALPDAPRELMAGWAIGADHIQELSDIHAITPGIGRVSMLRSRSWAPEGRRAPEPARCVIPTREQMRRYHTRAACLDDGALDGYVHCALRSPDEELCLARDVCTERAAEKVIGWALLTAQSLDATHLWLPGLIDEAHVRLAASIGIPLLISDVAASRRAIDLAQRARIALVGMAALSTPVVLTPGRA